MQPAIGPPFAMPPARSVTTKFFFQGFPLHVALSSNMSTKPLPKTVLSVAVRADADDEDAICHGTFHEVAADHVARSFD